MIFGLAAALGWGFADLGAAVFGRRIGSFRVVILAQLSGLVAIWILAAALRPSWAGWPAQLLPLVGNGVIVAAAYVLHYRALELGPVALVSPVTAAYGVVPIILAILVLGERLTILAAAGAVLTMVGVVLTSIDPRQLGILARTSRAGLPYAVVSMVLFGFATFVLGSAARDIGWLPTVAIGRACTVLALVPIAFIRRSAVAGVAAGGLVGSLVVGLVDISGIAFFSRGAEIGALTLVTAVSATFPLIPFLGGITIFNERPAPTQALGVGSVIGGLVLLGLYA